MRSSHFAVLVAPLMLFTAAGSVQAANPVAGAIVGAGAGALIGQAFGGRDGAVVGSAIGAIAGAGIAQSGQHRSMARIGAPAPVRAGALPVHYRGPDYFVGPNPPAPRHRQGYWQRFQDGWGAPYWVWTERAPVRVMPPAVYLAPPMPVAPAHRLPRHFVHPERHFEGAAAPYRPDPRFDQGGGRQRR